jgi:hypothetical protein
MSTGLWNTLSGSFRVLAEALCEVLPPRLLRARRVALNDVEASAGAGARPKGRLWLSLPQERVLTREIALAAGNPARWRDRAADQLTTISPWASDEFLWDAALIEMDATGRATVQVALAQKAPLTALEQSLSHKGAVIAAIHLPASADRPRLCFRQDRRAITLLRTALMALSVGISFGGAVTATIFTRQALAAVTRAEDARAATARILAATDTPDDTARAAQALLATRPPSESRALMLTTLASLLPDDSWASVATIDGAGFELTGRSQHPDAIVPLLEADGRLEQVDFSASSSRDPATGLFSFTVSGAASGGAAWP